MATPYSKLFSSFLGKFEDDIYVNFTTEQAEEDMIILLNAAIVEFEYPKVDITNKDDEASVFAEDLGVLEIEILAQLMKLQWIKRQLTSINLIRQKLSDKDFRLTSQAAHLEALLKLKNDVQDDIEDLKTKYSYRNGNRPDFSGLSGGNQ